MNCWTMKKLRIGGKKKNAELFENDASSDTINRIVSKKEQVIWFSFLLACSKSNDIHSTSLNPLSFNLYIVLIFTGKGEMEKTTWRVWKKEEGTWATISRDGEKRGSEAQRWNQNEERAVGGETQKTPANREWYSWTGNLFLKNVRMQLPVQGIKDLYHYHNSLSVNL